VKCPFRGRAAHIEFFSKLQSRAALQKTDFGLEFWT
jgi:hypothetical protein